MRENDDLDRAIDAALGSYGEADAGLERRVLARIAGERAPINRAGRMVWAIALATAACAALILILMHARPTRAPETSARNAPILQQSLPPEDRLIAPRTTRPAIPSSRHMRPGRPLENAAERSVAAALPKQEVFPTPHPLSPEERALADFAAQAPTGERRSFVEAQKQMDEPADIAEIRIDAIQIPPLEPPTPGAN